MTLVELHDNCCKYLLHEKGETQATIDTYRANFREFCRWLESEGLLLEIANIGEYTNLRKFMYHLFDRKLIRIRLGNE